MKKSKESATLYKIKQLMELSGVDTKKYTISMKKNQEREPLPPTVMLFQTFSSLASSRLTPSACKVMFFFFSQTQYQNVISLDQFSIAKHVHLSERTVRTAIKELKEYGVINSVPVINDNRRNEYFLNPYSSWKGSSVQRNSLISNMDPAQLNMFDMGPKELKKAEKEKKKNNEKK